MTAEQLMKPRFKVIALYPYPCPFVIGQVLQFVEQHQMLSESGWVKVHDEFPHLFKKLEWWEERSQDEMPEYVAYNGKISRVRNLIWRNDKVVGEEPYTGNGLFHLDNQFVLKGFSYREVFPATKEEYETFNQSNP